MKFTKEDLRWVHEQMGNVRELRGKQIEIYIHGIVLGLVNGKTFRFRGKPIKYDGKKMHLLHYEERCSQWIPTYIRNVNHFQEVILGISTDERQREKLSTDKWKTHVYPLLEHDFSRQDCLDFCRELGITPPRSACIMCPYRSDREWIYLRDNFPEEFKAACDYDVWLRLKLEGKKTYYKSTQYVHSSLVPLGEVEFRHDKQKEMAFGMENECDGICGV